MSNASLIKFEAAWISEESNGKLNLCKRQSMTQLLQALRRKILMGSIFTPALHRSSSLKSAPKPPAEECQDGNPNIIFTQGSPDSSEVSVHEVFIRFLLILCCWWMFYWEGISLDVRWSLRLVVLVTEYCVG